MRHRDMDDRARAVDQAPQFGGSLVAQHGVLGPARSTAAQNSARRVGSPVKAA